MQVRAQPGRLSRTSCAHLDERAVSVDQDTSEADLGSEAACVLGPCGRRISHLRSALASYDGDANAATGCLLAEGLVTDSAPRWTRGMSVRVRHPRLPDR
jgi:hypothetical protein